MSKVSGNLFVIAAPSGAGKSSMIDALLKRHPQGSMQVSVSTTTRKPRPGEKEGEHYFFVDEKTFLEQVDKGNFYEYAKVFDHYYGTSRHVIEDTLASGVDVFLDIDWQGTRQVKAAYPGVHTVFILPPSNAELERRLRNRGQDSEEVIAKRMAKAQHEMSHYAEFSYLIVNEDFDKSVQQLEHIVMSQRLRRSKQQIRHREILQDLLAE
ncbi:guanylate kinase [Aliidiomarina maris]|uniref:Guanylate kinase n=1 Tax=Aliidiomarina maris TaxID=531312 RepID=A0A327WYY3_9GAMM|nr:guanylate kinase [Aliidiomarina maris]MBA3987662.1 guanylate kinase [Idiomarina sp.]RAJ98373.1 guanylate kinase [Aliidiomarina maris]RUO24808.1 guanylate kinase [Aliidiomarina maris]